MQGATKTSEGILSQEFFLTLQFLFAFLVPIYLEFYKDTTGMTITHIILYAVSYSMIKLESRKIQSSSTNFIDLH